MKIHIAVDSVTASKLFADRAFDNNNVFRWNTGNEILPCIRLRRNAMVNRSNHSLSNLLVIFQTKNNLQEWMDSVRYDGQRCIAETVFSCIKRTFVEEYVYSARVKNMIQEIMLKSSLYNK